MSSYYEKLLGENPIEILKQIQKRCQFAATIEWFKNLSRQKKS